MRAEIDLTAYFDVIKMTESLDELKIGNIKLYTFDGDVNKSYTKINLKNIKETFFRALCGKEEGLFEYKFDDVNTVNDLDLYDEEEKSEIKFRKFIEWMDKQSIKRLSEMMSYNRFLFEIGLLSPVKYFKDGPIKRTNGEIIDKIKNRLIQYDFKLYVNDIEIFKPIFFPHIEDGIIENTKYYKIYEKIIDLQHNGKNVKGYAYIYHQNVRIIPYELRGIIIRYKNIGIGTYDNPFSKIATETPIDLYQITGELYIDEGLDDALNIDRNSFFESNEMYQKLLFDIWAWTNPKNLPQSDLMRDITIPSNPVSKDIRERMTNLRENNKIKKGEEELKANSLKIKPLLKI